MCRAIRPHSVLTCLFPETCHGGVNRAWQASDLFTGERTKAWRGGVTSPRPRKVGRSTLSCVSGETSKGQGMSREGLPPCKNPSSSICGPLLFLLSIKDTMENTEKHKEENKSHLWFSLSYFLSQLYWAIGNSHTKNSPVLNVQQYLNSRGPICLSPRPVSIYESALQRRKRLFTNLNNYDYNKGFGNH